MTSLLNYITAIVTSVSTMVGTWVSVIFEEGNEILALFALIPLVGIGIGALKRLLKG